MSARGHHRKLPTADGGCGNGLNIQKDGIQTSESDSDRRSLLAGNIVHLRKEASCKGKDTRLSSKFFNGADPRTQ